MLRLGRAVVVCLAVVFLLSGQTDSQMIKGFKVKGDSVGVASVNATSGNVTITTFARPGPGCAGLSFTFWLGNYCPDTQQETLMSLINSDRANVGAPALQWHSGLSKAAIDHLMTDAPDTFACLKGFSNIFQDLTVVGRSLPQEFVTVGPNFEPWDIGGRLFGARAPSMTFSDIGVVLARQQLPNGQVGNAATIYFGAIAANKFTRAIARQANFTTMGSAFDPRLGTWVVVFGQGVNPLSPTCNP